MSLLLKKYEVIGVTGLPEFKYGDDLGSELLKAIDALGLQLLNGDILVVAQKVISKVEGKIVRLEDVKPSDRAVALSKISGKDPRFVELVLRESKRIEVVGKGHLIVTTKHGITCANAGIDVSNVDGKGESVLLLPDDPDSSAHKLRVFIKEKSGVDVGVIISDTHGRTLRDGQINVAIGLSGMNPFHDYRGTPDMKGYVLRIKQIAVADELASASELIIGQAQERIPVAIIRGLSLVSGDETGSAPLNMPKERWLFQPVGEPSDLS
jgi:coenzyme F420-0:L-glutamate ligase/coenzyme F420-1:gamma-L-glutamate ligase